VVDTLDDPPVGAANLVLESRSQDGIDENAALLDPPPLGRKVALLLPNTDGRPHVLEYAIIGKGIPLQTVGRAQTNHPYLPAPVLKNPCQNKTVAGIIAAAGHDGDPFSKEVG